MSSCTIDEYDGTISVVQFVWTTVQWRGRLSISRQWLNCAIPHSTKKLVLTRNSPKFPNFYNEEIIFFENNDSRLTLDWIRLWVFFVGSWSDFRVSFWRRWSSRAAVRWRKCWHLWNDAMDTFISAKSPIIPLVTVWWCSKLPPDRSIIHHVWEGLSVSEGGNFGCSVMHFSYF